MDADNQQPNDDEIILEEIANTEIMNVKEALRKLYDVWQIFGIDSNQKAQRARAVWVHIKNLLNDIFDEETTFCNDTKERIENFKVKIQELSKALSISPKEINDKSLIKQEEMLRQELDSLSKLKHKRLKSYRDLKNVELQLCRILNMPEHQLPSNTGVPSENDLDELQQHIDMLKKEKEMRHKKLCKVKKELTTIWETTELTPETPLEKEILSEKENFSLSNETFKALEEIINKAKKKKIELETEKKTLMNKLNVLWERLKIDESKRVAFLSNHVDYRLSTIKSIQGEIERCEKIKKDNIKMFIRSLRQELHNLWDKCYVSETLRQQFEYFSCSEATDEILEAHEAEVEKWKSYYEDVQHIIKKIEKRKELWELMIVFENKAADPNRFKNRKGNLLQEEKERKRLQKELPALENSIFQDIEVYEREKGSPFLYYGEDYRQVVTKQWVERINQKENEKQERHKQHLLQLGNVTGTPGKRPLMTTPKSAPSKMLKSSTGVSMFQTPAAHSSRMVPSTTGKSTSKVTRLFTSRPNAIQRKDQKMVLRERNQQNLIQSRTSPNGTTYTDFASELNRTSRWNLRSSVLATRKPGGTRISLNNNKNKKSLNCSQNKKSLSSSRSKRSRKSIKNISGTMPGLTPARGKLGLPFLI
ncbi:Protein regulator of cytokinesis 1 like protein [Argiope bruennichi]|uniref:Protein regulator of cytokinesis 1 like protein n=1 Tax=Argiope bruennichi TaxID=94029 RepID=A0A8T0ELR0_ARGBR|nr:Protein regulator of cytokinesis 1 like protein [Argiope bruennichi]